MKVKARFKGTNGSLGYKTGKMYKLDFGVVSVFGTAKSRIEISDSHVSSWDKNTICQYASLKKFLENWDVI
jgi:hypothetical protein